MMKKTNYILTIVFTMLTSPIFIYAQSEPWKPDQLIEPKDLAAMLNDSNSSKPLLISIGLAGLIKGAVDIGPVKEKENLSKLKNLLSKEKKDRDIVIYCGCCPFQVCPNIRPAFKLLNEMKFTSLKLLNLPHNLKADWINYGYPMKR